MSKLQIALIILAIVAIVAVPLTTYFVSTGTPNETHDEHEFSDAWKSDEASHWKACSGDGCNIEDQLGPHAFGEGVETTPATEAAEGVMTYTCTVCGYEKTKAIEKLIHTHTYESEWSNDDTYHWHASTCGHDETDKVAHSYDDGYITKPATDEENGIIVYTCVDCGYDYEDTLYPTTHKHVFADEMSYDDDYHWYAATCGHDNIKGKGKHNLDDGEITTQPTEEEEGITSYSCITCDYVKEEPIAKLPHVHVYDENNDCKCGYHHEICDICGGCMSDDCPDCKTQCAFRDMNKVVTFAPNTTLAAPEGPNGLAPGKAGAYLYDESITASQVVLEDGAYATLVTLPNGTAAHSGISFANNKNVAAAGLAGYNCGIPQFANVAKPVRMYFTNTGSSEISFKYSAIDYYYDKGAVEVTLAAGESKTVILYTTFSRDTIGLNHQIVFPEGAEEGASLTIWGEFVADNITNIKVATVNKLNFGLGEKFSAEGLILTATGTSTNTTYPNTYERVYISQNYTVDLEGYTFTEEDVVAGKKTVTVSFAGLTATYEVVVYDHIHEIEAIPEVAAVKCTSDGVEAYYKCNADGCGRLFSDQYGNNVISAPKSISCHTPAATAIALPGSDILCADCSAKAGTVSTDNWILFTLPTTADIGSNIKNGKIEHATVNGMPGTKFYIGAGTVGATNNSSFYLDMSTNEAGYQTVIPNVANQAASGLKRTVVLYYENYSDEAITMNLQNEKGGSYGMCKVIIPANGSTVVSFTMTQTGGSNRFNYYVDFNPTKDVSFGVYGYIYVNDGETAEASINANAPATKTEFTVGDTFSADGLVLNAKMNDSYGLSLYAQTGYTTDYDGKVFTESDIGTHTVTVDFCGKTVTYEITVKAKE